MKIFLALLLISVLEIILKCEELHETNKVIRTFPKQIKTPIQRSIKIINARKFDKLRSLESRKAFIKKKPAEKDTYTVFPSITEKRLWDLPDDDFQGEFVGHKTRVKKVLPEHVLSFPRKKRSIKTNVTEGDKKLRKKKKSKGKRSHSTNKEESVKITQNVSKSRNRRLKSKTTSKENVVKYRNKKSNRTKDKNRDRKRSTVNLKYTPKIIHKSDSLEKLSNLYKSVLSNRHRNVKPQEKVLVRNRRLIAARDAMIQDYPYVVSIQKDGEHWCAGSLLNPRLVITTANCVWKARSVSRMRIRAGSRYVDRGGQVAKIQEVVKHPSWSIRSLPDYDVALLLLDRDIKFSDSVHSVDLPNRAMWPAFDDAWVTSWGAERRDGIFQSMGVTLQVYHAMVMNHDKCNNITKRFGIAVSRNFICLAQTGRRAPCTRDTGAPAVSDGILWGMASWGIRKLCGTERYPAMFSYLASRPNLDFITNATHHLMSDKRHYPYPDRFVVKAAETSTSLTDQLF